MGREKNLYVILLRVGKKLIKWKLSLWKLKIKIFSPIGEKRNSDVSTPQVLFVFR
jgi:hypothetical protein